MEFFRIKKDIPFMSYGKVTTSISLLTFLFAVFFLATKGLNFGVDFTGGTVIEVHYSAPADINKVRQQLAGINLQDALVQNFGSSQDVLIQVPLKQNAMGAKLSEHVLDTLRRQDANVELRRVEFVGPQVGKDLVENGAMALLLVSLGIVGYLWLRFEWKFGLAAIIANLHDVVIILGCFAFFQWEFSLSVLAAVLAVLGYSVNESVVVFDRIRENFRKMRKTEVAVIIDNAITRTMSRTIITHGSTQLMVLAMLFLGGETLHFFALALTIGILFSIYSSVLVASPLLMIFGVSREDFIKPEKTEGEEVLP
ncbi:MAG: protein translocase subunit SecF [Gallionella sp.]|nr:protein translocase subunit SecF [Gallionella sp.]PIR10167.1 MAG: protein translocase subunit SecF [Gallionellaceae bacterium CG11_big_fil_rev_8_21_14_0_20_60_62]PIV47677.1 MAG: protein translocase subunit SecF [Gallionellaceae bacterium CG02_land_8_20_14_3_00_60_115]PIY06076.1 MAG: protein translocase subunit SecF [Gallionellaceae bacterium CG_4_10_14_3_um_filter_60_1069]